MNLRSRLEELTGTVGGRALVAMGAFVAIVVPLALIAKYTEPTTAHTLAIPLDDAIPFLPWTVYIYSWVDTSMLLPVFVVRDPALFRRVVAAYFIVAAISAAVYLVYPVTSMYLRPDLSDLDPSVFLNWVMRLTYWFDPPTNLFPSLHVGIALISGLAAYTARPLYGWLSLPIVVGICVTICTTKQHYIVDGVAAFLVVAVAWKLTLASYRAREIPVAARALTWRGPLAYLVFHCVFYGVFYVAFLTGDFAW